MTAPAHRPVPRCIEEEEIVRYDEAAWVAGLFEGEGCIYIDASTTPHRVHLEVKMTDEDTIRRLHAVVGCGNVTAQATTNPRHLSTWKWKTADAWEVRRFLHLVRPWLGDRRGAKADEALEWIKKMRSIA